MAKHLLFNTSDGRLACEKIQAGIKQLTDAVRVTLGPTGRVVMYDRSYGDPIVTKDGVTVAKQIELEDPFENMAASMVRQAASRTAIAAGDGTTTAAIYAEAIFNAGIKSVGTGANPQDVKRGIDAAVQSIVSILASAAKPVVDLEQIKQVAICSSNQDEIIGSIITEAMDRVGKDGVITIEEGRGIDTTVEVVDGFQILRGYGSPQFATDPETLECVHDNANILVTDEKIEDLKLVLKILEVVVKNDRKPLVIIADEFSDDCLGAFILNRIKAQINVVTVKAPGYGDSRRNILEDIAIATGAKLLSASGISLSQVSSQHFGSCDRVRIDRDTTVIVGGHGDESQIQERLNLLSAQINKVSGDFDRERIQERMARLTGSVAQILVGGLNEAEVREKKDRIDDALHACKAAIEEGILPGGGVAALHASKSISYGVNAEVSNNDFEAGINIVRKAIESPIRQIAINTGKDDGVIVNKVIESSDVLFGYDAAVNRFGNMIDFGIIVPAKVERVALQNAASVACLLLTTDCIIATSKSNNEPQAPLSSMI